MEHFALALGLLAGAPPASPPAASPPAASPPAASPPAAAPPAAPAPPREWVEFIGFSKDGRLAAYRRDVDVTLADGGHDQYTLMQTLDAHSGFELAVFQTSIHRITADGHPVAIKRAALAKEHPRYDGAFPSKRWMELEKRSRFHHVPVHTNPDMLQIGVDEDVEVETGEAPAGLMFAASADSPLGFQVVLHGKDGKAVDGGVFRQEGKAGQVIAARLQVFTPKSRHGAAIVVNFLITRGAEVVTAPMLKIIGAELAKVEAPPPAPAAETTRRNVDPWKMKFSPDAAPPKMSAADRAKVPAGERRAIEQIYHQFVGDPLPMPAGD